MQTDRKELSSALAALKGAVSSRPGIPALTGVLVEGDGAGGATLTATDLETTATARVGAGDGAGFRALVPFKILADTVKAAGGERVGLEHVDGHVKVAGASIRLLPAEDFPTIAEPAELVGAFDAAELRDAIGAVAIAASRDEARPVLTGLLLEVLEPGTRNGPSAATLTATDSYRLHTAELSNGAVRPGRYIIPERTCSYVAKLIGRRPASERVAVRCSESAVMFELGAVRVTVRLIEGEFPNWRQLVPEGDHEDQVTFTYDRAELEGALKAAGPFARDTNPVRFRFGPYGVGLSASSADLGDWSALLARADTTGPELAVAFNPAYLAGSVRAVGDGARMVLRDGLKPAILTSADGRIRALVMPVRPPVGSTWEPGPGNPYRAHPAVEYAGVPGVGVNAPHEPTAEERAAGEPVEDPTDPGAAEQGQPAEAEPEPTDDPIETHPDAGEPEPAEPEPAEDPAELRERLARAAEPGGELRRRLGRTEDSAEQWSELADIGTVAGAGRSAVRVRVVVGPDGSPMVDARRFVDSARYSGPTRKGFALRPGEAGQLAELLRDAQAAAEAL